MVFDREILRILGTAYPFVHQKSSGSESGLCKWIDSMYFRRRCFQSAAYRKR